ncbi:hypothetical protein DFH06DRAFT_1122419 [Mycena polygramma]|nr:hypothetical protein DFH06DRAFT_1122419 [Mycena polygramma]
MALPGVEGRCFVPGAWLKFQEAYPSRMMEPKPERYTGYQACAARVFAPVTWSPSAVDPCAYVGGGVRDGVYLDKEQAEYTTRFPGQEAIAYSTIDDALAHHTIECQGRHAVCRIRNMMDGTPCRPEIVDIYETRLPAENKAVRCLLLYQELEVDDPESDNVELDSVARKKAPKPAFPHVVCKTVGCMCRNRLQKVGNTLQEDGSNSGETDGDNGEGGADYD